ncbi:hypothetical protein RGF97_13925 [Streptomyces roseicoloratus]|uniref:Uncharacterized protein n=1 Tax=Streptomyces roseicoloratus TaxID=2508722 RepID=A0ABY9RU73_9ACTN|nr:hypothetical protein [Streptomyces roseicoloratus]WMX45731.1 hypothetical protein RGF97_13925 [Streptomyces roseicoloratus]
MSPTAADAAAGAGTPGPDPELELVGERAESGAPPGPTTVLRLLGALPPRWRCRPVAEEQRVTLRIRTPASTPEEARARLTQVLADPALRGWHWRWHRRC